MIALIIMAAVFSAYLLATWKKGKIASSISASFYNWGTWKRVYFIGMCWGISVPVVVVSIVPWYWANAFLIAGAMCIMLVGTFADFKHSKIEEWLHVIPSYGGILLSLVGLGILTSWAFLGIFIGAMGLLKWFFKVNNLTWWVEIAAFICIWLGLLVTL